MSALLRGLLIMGVCWILPALVWSIIMSKRENDLWFDIENFIRCFACVVLGWVILLLMLAVAFTVSVVS